MKTCDKTVNLEQDGNRFLTESEAIKERGRFWFTHVGIIQGGLLTETFTRQEWMSNKIYEQYKILWI
jgi:hypothetical protein